AVHTPETRQDRNEGSVAFPTSRYDFRLKTLTRAGKYWVADLPLTPGIVKSVTYYDPDTLVTYSGALWELSPVEVVARPRAPLTPSAAVDPPEQQVMAAAGIDLASLKAYLKQNDLALVVSRNITTRDKADLQQPFNLQVAGAATRSLGGPGKVYDVAY